MGSSLAGSDVAFQLEKALEAYKTTSDRGGLIGKLDWLDKITITRVQDSLSVLSQRVDAASGVFRGIPPAETTSAAAVHRGSINELTPDGGSAANADITTLQSNASLVFWVENDDERELRENMYCLVIEFPQYPHAIIFEEKTSIPVTPHAPLRSLTEGLTGCVTHIVEDDTSTALEFAMSSKFFNAATLIANTGQFLPAVYLATHFSRLRALYYDDIYIY